MKICTTFENRPDSLLLVPKVITVDMLWIVGEAQIVLHRGTVQSATFNDPLVVETVLFKPFLPLYHGAYSPNPRGRLPSFTIEFSVLGAKSTLGQRLISNTY